jgi:hypothetical protein
MYIKLKIIFHMRYQNKNVDRRTQDILSAFSILLTCISQLIMQNSPPHEMSVF